MKKNLLLVFCSFSLVFSTTPVLSANLLGIYRQALQNDPEWAATESNYEADKEKPIQAKAGLRPSLFLNYSRSRVSRNAPEIGTGLGSEFSQGLSDCLTAGSGSPECADLPGIIADPNNPLFEFTQSGSTKSSTTADNLSLQFTQPLLNLERLYAYRASKSALLISDSDFNDAQQQFFLKIVSSYFNALKAKKELEYAQSENKATYDQLQQTKTRYELGLIRITDVHEAQSALDLSRSLVILSDGLLQNAYEDLNAMTGSTIFDIEALSSDFTASKPLPSGADHWVDIAMKNSEKILASMAAVKTAELDIIQTRSGHVPTVELFARLDNVQTDAKDDSSFNMSAGDFTSDSNTETIGVKVAVPIYTGGRVSSRVRESQHRLDSTAGRLERTIRSVTSSVRNSYRQVENDLKRITVFTTSLESTQRALKSTSEEYRTGNRTIFDVLHAERRVFSTRRDLSNAKNDYIINSLRLKMAAGILKSDDLLTINSWLSAGAN